MSTALSSIALTRRAVLRGASWVGLGLTGATLSARSSLGASGPNEADERELIRRLTGGTPTQSPLVQIEMPPVFGNGFSVPFTLIVDSPMTETDYVRLVSVLAPRNPIVTIASFRFSPQSGRAAVSTRIRLAESQNVIAVAEMNDGPMLMARKWVEVETNGCL